MTKSTCCDNLVTTKDLASKIFHVATLDRHPGHAPIFGVLWLCPSCLNYYLACPHRIDRYWPATEDADHEFTPKDGRLFSRFSKDPNKGRFVLRDDEGNPVEQTGCFVIELYPANEITLAQSQTDFTDLQLVW